MQIELKCTIQTRQRHACRAHLRPAVAERTLCASLTKPRLRSSCPGHCFLRDCESKPCAPAGEAATPPLHPRRTLMRQPPCKAAARAPRRAHVVFSCVARLARASTPNCALPLPRPARRAQGRPHDLRYWTHMRIAGGDAPSLPRSPTVARTFKRAFADCTSAGTQHGGFAFKQS